MTMMMSQSLVVLKCPLEVRWQDLKVSSRLLSVSACCSFFTFSPLLLSVLRIHLSQTDPQECKQQ